VRELNLSKKQAMLGTKVKVASVEGGGQGKSKQVPEVSAKQY